MPFPTSPDNGDTYESQNGTLFVYDSSDNKWSIWGTPEAVLTPIQFELQFEQDYRTYTQVYSWVSGELTGVDFYTTGNTGTKLYEVTYTWSSGYLTNKTISGINQTLDISYNWVSGELDRKDRDFI